ncbi:Sec-independent protein translocase protein TatB [Rhizobium binae]|uniref:Sec-independent protein translocase protein TatB n=1 Tax=Rhizobium binae TaxID=1138190 RepID=UPI001C83ABE6|nr:Sec-independent protein translocase protein TatB [Rhizobium binae]MBX4940911.1 twin-arginine translocase subunit TatB [Rhizobium binae]MBX4942317.1 twin-arginine translocase subunit TatB [Rhizobium binae]MBX4960644.1 twin-arginine translocase subunit TatB [Rhizobium binae]MBX4967028.1 twin-arginine translocase subunit TatB [Rhizobium binae]MBX4982037.1 twin-arginine translocase subunit TatB [Rhizobium binae]
MFDIGWTELLVIAVVLIVVVGPKDLPPMLRAFGKMTQRARKVAGEFRAQFDEALREAELDDVRQTISDAQKLNPVNSLREAMNPLRQMGNEIKADLQRTSTASDNKTEVPPAAMSTPTPSMSLPETPPLVSAPEPAAAAVAADAVAAKPKAPRKPRVKAADKAAFAIAAPAENPPAEKRKRTTAARKPATPKKPAQTKKKDEV